MTNILRIDASSRPGHTLASFENASHSRKLADALLDCLTADASAELTAIRDLAENPLPMISNSTIQGFYTPAEEMDEELKSATALSDALIAEIEAADLIVISCPIYNFSIPAGLKAWVDQVVRIGRTLAYEDGNFAGLLEGKRAYVAYAYGAPGYSEGGPLQSFDYMKPYLTMILNFIGIEEVHSFAVEGTTGDSEAIEAAHAKAQVQIENHFAKVGGA